MQSDSEKPKIPERLDPKSSIPHEEWWVSKSVEERIAIYRQANPVAYDMGENGP